MSEEDRRRFREVGGYDRLAENMGIKSAPAAMSMSGPEHPLFEAVGEGSYDPDTDKLSIKPVLSREDPDLKMDAVINTGMSDDLLVNEIIRVVGLERLEIIVDMLEYRLLTDADEPATE